MTTQPEFPMLDLRSDTVTRPTPAMRAAMAAAPVGDDVYGDDPTVAQLEARVAALAGKQAALFMPSGTMANQVALRLHTQPGDAVLCEDDCHIANYEAGGPAALSGVTLVGLRSEGGHGVLAPESISAALPPLGNVHYAPARLLLLENTHNRGGGTVWPQAATELACAETRAAGLACHLDGARIWNAMVATRRPLSELAAPFDTLAVCFSKGLGAPVGSALVGPADLLEGRGRRIRKMLGGGLRQAGILAAGALYALENHVDRLADDHRWARALAVGLRKLPGARWVSEPQTNIVFFEWAPRKGMPPEERAAAGQRLLAECRSRGLLFNQTRPGRFRLVTHLDCGGEAGMAQALAVLHTACVAAGG